MCTLTDEYTHLKMFYVILSLENKKVLSIDHKLERIAKKTKGTKEESSKYSPILAKKLNRKELQQRMEAT